MLSKVDKIKDKRPGVRRLIDKISDFCDKMLVVDYIILISFSAVMICVPTFMTFFCMSDKDRGWIASIVGGVLSLIVIPLLINHINRKQKIADELSEINKHLYQELSAILIQLLAEEYILHDENKRVQINTSDNLDKAMKVVGALKDFICKNYDKMCNTFSDDLIWDTIDVYNECLHSVTKYSNIREKVRKCLRNVRRKSGVRGSFYINQSAINMLCHIDDEYKENRKK